jgi:hypothetical protein
MTIKSVMPAFDGSTTTFARSDGTAATPAGGGAVDSVNGFTGVVVLAAADVGAAATSHTHAASDIVSGTIDTARLGSGTPSGATFLRGDQTWASPTASVAATTVEVNIGSTPKWTGKFTITDAAIAPTSKVLCWQAPGPYTGKGARADEAEMQPVQVIAVEPGTGTAVVKWQTPMDAALVELPKTTSLGAGTAANSGTLRQDTTTMRRRGKVRGNVKFSYSVFA